MDKNKSLKLASVIFGLIALLHLIRGILGWPASVYNFKIPVYFSYLAALVLGFLAWRMYDSSRK
ncbi:MAG: hypothetical protein AABX32_00635 [Nanoarchaeota archaeon]